MCGILGFYSVTTASSLSPETFTAALGSMLHRGPDDGGVYQSGSLFLGHRRLSIIDLSTAAHQPMFHTSGRYCIVFNGEIFNFRELKEQLTGEGISFQSDSDTEVLLALYIRHGERCLSLLNGFFAFAIHDKETNELFIARDRYGIKPLYYFADNQTIAFGSEINALRKTGIRTEIDTASLLTYFQLNYIPGPATIYEGIRKLSPGHYLHFHLNGSTSPAEQSKEICWYQIPYTTPGQKDIPDYETACNELYRLLDAAVERRMISDVPLGAFLSGGVDSSIITALAARKTENLHTYSIGFIDEPAFDETAYSQLVAEHCGTQHTAFRLHSGDLLDALPAMSSYFDEPFADSSALAVFILARETRKHVTVSLSGDGSDELFAGYRKHRAEWILQSKNLSTRILPLLSTILKPFSGSRQSKIGNKFRQLHRFAEGAALSTADRYWRWCSISSLTDAAALLQPEILQSAAEKAQQRKEEHTKPCTGEYDFNKILLNDCKLVLPGDMLTKVDLMSMANSLEVRVPFLDVEVVNYAFRLPADYKINKTAQKRILRDSFGKLLPAQIFERPKQGFEIPLANWFRESLNAEIKSLLAPELIKKQGIFNPTEINKLVQSIHSEQQGEATGKIWALLVFQYWWFNKHMQ